MEQAGNRFFNKVMVLLLTLGAMLALFAHSSGAFVLDNFEYNEDGTPKHNSSELKQRDPDTSCVSEEISSLSKLPLKEMSSILKGLPIERHVDIYICSSKAFLSDLSEVTMEMFLSEFPRYFNYLLKRVEAEQDDRNTEALLAIFAGYGFADYQGKIKANGDLPTYDELFFKADTARSLVSKADSLKNENARNFFLDYLIPLLPYDEAVARQAQREEARKKSGK